MSGNLPDDRPDTREGVERILFARGVLEILKGTGLFNFLIDKAIADLDAAAAEFPPDEM